MSYSPYFAAGYATFTAIVLLPFAVVCCQSSSSGSAAPVDTGSRLVPNPDALPSAASATADVDASPAAPTASADAAASTSASTKPLTPRGHCEQIRGAFGRVLEQSRICKVDADCTEIYTSSCGLGAVCGAAVAKGSTPHLRSFEKPWNDANCTTVVLAPCPTCAAPPPPKCVSGKCE